MIHRDNIPHPGSSICVDWIVSTQSFDSQFLNRQFTELHGLCWIQKLHWPTGYETECHVYEESDKNAFTGEKKSVFELYTWNGTFFKRTVVAREMRGYCRQIEWERWMDKSKVSDVQSPCWQRRLPWQLSFSFQYRFPIPWEE